MGSIRVKAGLWPFGETEEDLQEIRAEGVWTSTYAMRVGRGGEDGNQLVYLDEVPIRYAAVKRHVPYQERDERGTRESACKWLRLEVKTDKGRDEIEAGHHLVMAMHPYSARWAQSAAFKVENRRGKYERQDPLATPVASREACIQTLETLPYDYFERGKRLTAGISEPDLPHDYDGSVKDPGEDGMWVFGVCEDVAACEHALLVTEEVQTLLRDTAAGRLRPRNRGHGIPLRFYDEVTDASNFLMALAIRQALAGPLGDPEDTYERIEYWQGRPVAERVAWIYREHLENSNRRLAILYRNLRKQAESVEDSETRSEPAEGFDGLDEEQLAEAAEKLGVPARALSGILTAVMQHDYTEAKLRGVLRDMATRYRRATRTLEALERRLAGASADAGGRKQLAAARDMLEAGEVIDAGRLLDQIMKRLQP